MKTLAKILVVAGCAALAWTAGTGVSEAATAQANTTATVVLPVTITKSVDLNFGKFMSGGSAGTVVVSTGGVQSVTPGVTTTAALGATAAAAAFTISGEPGSTYTITFPAQTALTRSGGGGTDMTIGTFTTAVTTGGTLGTFAGGNETLKLGATLSVNANQASGTYGGTIDVAVDYN